MHDGTHSPNDQNNPAAVFELSAAKDLLENLIYCELAQVAVLLEADLIGQELAKKYCKALDKIHGNQEKIKESFYPSHGDIYGNWRVFLRRELGKESDILQIGRSRREVLVTAFQMKMREWLIVINKGFTSLIKGMLELGEEHKTTLMPDFTYWQNAQVSTFGHTIMSYASAANRVLATSISATQGLNAYPGGICSTNGTFLPVNRNLGAKLLGFSSLTENTRDAMWPADIFLSVSQYFSRISLVMGRLCEDLLYLASSSTGFISFSDEHSRESFIMPNKRNPYNLSYMRGTWRSINTISQSVSDHNFMASGFPDSRFNTINRLLEASSATSNALQHMTSLLNGMTVHKDAMMQASQDPRLSFSEICNFVASRGGSFDAAYTNLKDIAAKHVEANLPADIILAAVRELIPNFAQDDESFLKKLINPAEAINLKSGIGSVNPKQMDSSIRNIHREINKIREYQEKFDSTDPHIILTKYFKNLGFL